MEPRPCGGACPRIGGCGLDAELLVRAAEQPPCLGILLGIVGSAVDQTFQDAQGGSDLPLLGQPLRILASRLRVVLSGDVQRLRDALDQLEVGLAPKEREHAPWRSKRSMHAARRRKNSA